MCKPKKNKFCKTFLVLSIFLFAIGALTKMFLSTNIAIKSGELKNLFEQKSQLEKEVSKLSYENASISSITSVEERAKKLGFVEMKDRLLSLDPHAPIQVASLQK